MHRRTLLTLLDSYRPSSEREKQILYQLRDFVLSEPDCFKRTLTKGHITGSAWLLNPSFDAVLLCYHKKLKKWLQPGGHADGESDPLKTAIREAEEESGINHIKAIDPGIFDIDIHPIPEHKDTPAHLHYDVRFILLAPHAEFIVSDESEKLAWVPFNKLFDYSEEESVLRMDKKARALLAKLLHEDKLPEASHL